MVNVKAIVHAVSDVRAILAVIALAVLSVIAWFFWFNPLTGFVSVTHIGSDGAIRATELDLVSKQFQGIPYLGDQTAVAIAAVPSPTSDKYAFLIQSRGEKTRLSIANPDGTDAVVVADGELDVPSWSPDGGSIAFARKDSDGELFTPDDWRVFRAVRNGDSLAVGNGYRPFPSPHQRTYALTSRGIVLLSYNDTEPAIVIASPSPVPLTTPFVASQDALRLAWVAPWDKSLQVYEDVNGYLIPLLLKPNVSFNSLVFSPSGKHLLGATYIGTSTKVELITVASGNTKVVGEYEGFITLNAWRYEK